MGANSNIYIKEMLSMKKALIEKILFFIYWFDAGDGDWEGWPSIHIRLSEDDFLCVGGKCFTSNNIVAYTGEQSLIDKYKAKKLSWSEIEELPFGGGRTGWTHKIEIPYEDIILEDLYMIADMLNPDDEKDYSELREMWIHDLMTNTYDDLTD